MGNNLYKVEKDLRSIAKRYRSVKYSLGLAILFLMLGVGAFSEEVNLENSQVVTREELKTSVGNVQTKLNVLRNENKEKIKNLRLELIQLMEQGDQVVKSPWSSWQFGMNYFYENWGSTYKGSGDKSEKYVFNGIYTRGNWKVRNAMDMAENQRVGGRPLTPGNDSLNSWKNASNSSGGGVTIDKDTSIGSSTNGNKSWGLVDLRDLREPTNEVEILAHISPKEVTKQAISLNITEPTVQTLEAPDVNPQVNEPLPAPVIELPEVETVTINPLSINAPSAPTINIGITAPSAPSAPTINVVPTSPSTPSAPSINIGIQPPRITPLSITTPDSVGTITINTPTINPVDFMLSPSGLSGDSTRKFNDRPYDIGSITINVTQNGFHGNYISTWGRVKNLDGISTNVNVNVEDTRAFMVDEGIKDDDPVIRPFRYTGTINLNKSKNVGIDVQGTHTSLSDGTNTGPGMNDIKNVANIRVINEGKVIGNGGPSVKNQVGFGFNNFDASSNNTRTEMINRGNGTITLGAPESAGIQLRPEDPWSSNNGPNRGLNMMTGENTGTVTINSYGSFGILTVKNRDLTYLKSHPSSTKLANTRDYTNYKVKTTSGGQIASRAQETNMSYIKNTGDININGDDSVGVGLLHNIQGVTIAGNINIGNVDPSSFSYSNKTGGNNGKVEGAVGVYSEVRTRPILNGDYDDHALQNTSGKTLGTETVEVSGKVELGSYAEKSSGLRIKDEGSITLKNGGEVLVGGKNNYGAVVNGKDYNYYRKTVANAYAESGTKYSDTGKINLDSGSKITVTGEESIGYALLAGKGINAGTITVTGHTNNNTTGAFHGSLGFYGEKGTFTNIGEISSSGNIAHAVALVGDATDGTIFKNNGKINVVGKGNIGVYADGKYTFEHSGSGAKISVGSDSLGIYAKNSNGNLDIKAPIELANSNTATTIGIYSDGDANVKFGTGSKLKIGEKAVGLYSADPTKFNNTFKIETGKTLDVELGKNSTFGLLNGNNIVTNSPLLSKYLNNNTSDKINIVSFGEGASLFYATSKAKAILDEDYKVTNGDAISTAVLVANNGANVEIASGKKLETNTNAGLIAINGTVGFTSVAKNNGTLISTRIDKGIGIYTSAANGENSGTITMQNKNAVGILGSKGSNLKNTGKIELEAVSSVGVYAEDSNMTNSGTTSEIIVNKEASVGIYAKETSISSVSKNVKNEGKIEIKADGDGKSAGIYSKKEGGAKLTIENTGNIEVAQKASAGIYAKNESTQANTQSEVTNSGLVKMSAENSIGIMGEKSKITNTGTGTKGIEIVEKKSAGILVTNESAVINSGRISLSNSSISASSDGLVGISVDGSSTGENDASGEIKVDAAYSTGMLSSGGGITNAGKIALEKKESVGMYATNANVTNSGATPKGIFIKDEKSVGIYSKINSSSIANKTVTNSGTIDIAGTSKTGSAGIYSIIESGATKKLSVVNNGNITINQKKSVGIYAKNESSHANTESDVTNSGKIEVKNEGSAGVLAEKYKVTNTGSGTNGIIVSAKKSAGIIGKLGSEIINSGIIKTETATPTVATDGVVGISLNNSKATNTSGGVITLDTDYSTGMYGEANSQLTNEGNITGTNKEYIVGMAGDSSTVTNKNIITLNGKKATGIFGKNSSTLLNETTGKITTKEEESVGMYSSSSLKATNKGTIITEKKTSAGMLGDKANIENDSSITTKEEMSAGMYVKNGTSKATNKGTVTTEKKTSAGILAEIDEANGGTVSGLNEITGTITVSEETSAGMLGKVKSAVTASTAKLSLTNKKDININTKNSAGIMVVNESTAVGKENVLAENTGTINLTSSSATNEKNIGILANKATGINTGNINVNSKESIGMLGQNASSITNNKTITLSGEKGIGMLSKDTSSIADNNDTINVNGKESLGMLGEDSGTVKNNKTISVTAEKGVGIFVRDNGVGKGSGTGENTSTGTITLENKEAVGIFAKNNGTSDSAKNSGTINLGKADGSTIKESLIGMFAQAEAGKKANVKNTKDINVNTKKSVGIYAKNDASNITDVDLENTGDININSKESAGVYAPKANISKVGTITLKNSIDSNGSSAVYVSKGGKVANTAGAKINLGTVNQNRVAYYVNGKDSALAGADIGKITGYGVGVYLQGTSGDKATLDKNTSKLDYTLQGTGNGIIGLLLKGETDIQSYTKGIKVGNTVAATSPSDKAKYAIGIYADAQGTAGTPYNITTPITAGKSGVGIFADKDSNINYTGNMEIGDGTTAGTGIFITKKIGATGGKVTLGTNTIKLKGTKGVVAIASEGTTFNGGNATIELVGSNIQGVGVYAKKGSTVNIDHWTFNNNGNSAEEVRSEEGRVYINANKNLKPKMVLTHVINGETSIATGKTVTSVNDGSITAKENIGLMAEGIKNHSMTWQEGNFEAVNHGIIDFSAAEKSTAMFINSARAKNDGTIKVGKNSIGIYGFYNKDTRKYDGASTNPDPNKLELETTSNSKISLGDASTGMYLTNAEKIENKGGQITSESGATKNVGIYAVNGQDTKVSANNKILNMTTATNINLGNGSVGLYSKGQSNTVRNTVTNTGDITVGDKITGSPSVAMYAENTNLTTNSKITVGKDGIAFYGKNSDITAKGSANFSNKGVLAYLENSKFVSHLGNLGSTQNTMLYLKNSIAQLDGAGTKVDMDVADGYTGAYIEGNSALTGVKTIKLGQDSTGLFLKDANFVSDAESITGTKDKARGILGVNSNFTNNSKISLSGAESIGIYSNAGSGKTVVNNGELTIAGKKTLGVFLKGSQSFENKANINIANSANSFEPAIGIYTAEGASTIKHTSGTIEVGEKSIGIYSKTPSNVEINGGKVHVKDQGIGIYKESGKLTIKGELDIDTHIATAKDSEPTGVYAVNGAQVDDQASKISIGAKSYGFILNNTDPNKTNIYTNTDAGTVSLGNDSVFLYSNGKANIINNRTINANGASHLIAFYIKNGGNFTNNGTIDFSTGKGNIGIYAPGGKATNKGRVYVGKTDDIDPMTGKVYSDVSKIVYGIGMAADNGGYIKNDGEIRIYNNKSIGMYGKGIGTTVENTGKIYLDGSRATATDKIQSMTGVYVDDGAKFINRGEIRTTDSYAGRDGKVNENVTGLVGVAVMNGSTLENHGKILIDADNSYGVIIRGKRDSKGNVERYAVIKNYGEIKVRGKGTWGISWKDVSRAYIDELQKQINDKISSDPEGQALRAATGTNKDYEGVTITVKNGKPTFLRNGVPISDSEVEQIGKLIGKESNLGLSDIGFYVDTLGRTKPIDIDGATPPINSQLIIGTEYSEKTNKKQWFVKGDVIKPFLDQIQGRNFKLTSIAGSLTWIATPVLDNYGQITGVAMAKLPYTSFVNKTDNAWNFADGLEQRYDMNALDSVEKRIFNKLNSIGKNEQTLLTQAYDEMMGHQYANVQQRVQATGIVLDKEFSHLRNSWSNPSKDSNKVKTFGMKGEYKTDTAGVIDYKYNAYGVAYVHENEDIKLGKGTGWYTGIVHNTFKFKDIGNSKEKQLQAKVGLFKSVPFDENNSLNWTISGDIFIGHNKLERKFLVVDEIFHAKSKYYTYGIGIKNEIGKEFRLSEDFSIRPYGALKVEYGRVSKIKEKSGEMKLEVKENDYLSIRPEIGTELAYRHYFGTKTLRTSVGVAYENELGRVANGKNKARVAGTTADWFNIRGEKEDRKGNVKVDLNVGIDNQRLGVTGNVGYDTKGHNVRGGVGLRVIF
ncbi:galactose-inhibitable autotransporter adhesin Fap2 [Fusobacterium nucleatum]|uniref:galactose-inhibitable autotransporter adhesin Fap2 n=1 Tax=Fusobacterium nucleatum TaxID=851 RepID=UPI0030D17B70